MTGSRPSMIATVVASLFLAGCSTATSGPTTTSSEARSTVSAPSPAEPGSTAPSTAATTDGSPATSAPPVATPSVATTVVSLAPGVSDEASGIAEARGTPGAYFLVDDATGTDSVVAVGADGALIARIGVEGMSADNAEAMASGTCGQLSPPGLGSSDSCLYVGDIGDNAERRDDIAIVRLAEPDLTDIPVEPIAADEWRYTYPDGPHNAEAMLLEPDGSLLVVTKPTGGQSHRMYRAAPGGGDLVFVREFRPPAAERPLRTLVTGNVVTDLAATPGRVLLLTYDEVQEFSAPTPDADLASFPDWPHRRLPMPWLNQAEAVTGAADGCGYAVASEAGPGGGTGSLAMMTCAPG